MTIIEITHPGTPAKGDPQIMQAMAVWDRLNGRERRELFRALARTVTAYERTEDVTHLTRFAESVDGMVRLETHTNLREVIRRHGTRSPRPEHPRQRRSA